ncbi:variable surface protein [Plasmodium gonderi]|uniref:Variable surface protein n=1 Tax=Plasmodium gonderi TaxID=77519 RepID=A0A1Y1JPP0_PLAGO|nr:variable surface protein [Plasmodium gonderi]GAW84586.1 variable surface protein [Plasmodium gonderi]
MSGTLSYEKIRYEKIFPQFRDIYNTTIYRFSNSIDIITGLSKLCNYLIMLYFKENQEHYVSLQTKCKGLGLYLYHIKDKITSDNSYKNLACIYFNYKLQDMLKNCECNIKDPETVYNLMSNHSYLVPQNGNYFLNICYNDITSLADSTFEIFMYFDQVYEALPFIEKGINCSFYDGKFKEYVNKLINYVPSNSSIATLLNDLITRYNKSIPNSKCPEPISLTKLGLIEISKTETILTQNSHTEKFLTEESEKGKIISGETAVHGIQIKHSGLSMGKWVGVVVLSSALLIMAFFLYKYTRNTSFIRQRARKLRKLMNIKSENHNDVLGSHEETYKNRIHNQYKIAYV